MKFERESLKALITFFNLEIRFKHLNAERKHLEQLINGETVELKGALKFHFIYSIKEIDSIEYLRSLPYHKQVKEEKVVKETIRVLECIYPDGSKSQLPLVKADSLLCLERLKFSLGQCEDVLERNFKEILDKYSL